MLSRIVFFAAVILALASPVSAQIYSWHDEAGNLVLSDQKHQGQATVAPSYAVPHADAVRTTKVVPESGAAAYDDLILTESRQNGVRTDLVRAVIQVESGFNPGARSPKGAMGLMQLMPATAQQFGVRNPFNPNENVKAGVAYLRQLLDRYDDNEELALAAYNAGPLAVDRHGETIPPYRETQNYVSKVSDLAGASGKSSVVSGTQMYRVVQIVNGQEVVLYTNDPAARVSPAAQSPSDPDGRTPDQAPHSSSIFPTR